VSGPTNILSLTGVQKAFGPRVILNDVTFGLDAGDKVGLIGDNGAGKSTLLSIVAGREAADAGVVARRSGLRVGLLAQVPDLDPGRTVRDVLSEPFAATIEAIARYEEAARSCDPQADAWLDAIERGGGWDFTHRVERVATELRLDDLEARVDALSGGQARRVALGRLVLEEPELILLDEPTNHLDMDAVEWIEGWLAQVSAACLLVTHDRYFLERVVSRMAEVREGQVRTYEGRYRDYLVARAEEEALRRRTSKRRLQVLEAEIEWSRRSPKARTTKSKARLERIDEATDEIRSLAVQRTDVDLRFGGAPRLGKSILELDRVVKGYGGPPVVDGLSLRMRRGERFGVIGPNGSGKTTLLRLVAGELAPDEGAMTRGANTHIAYFDQHRTALSPDRTVRRTVAPEGGDHVHFGDRALHVASYLERFGFDGGVHGRRVDTLSGGERNRLALARFLLEDANLLLLDEPTNDLDLMTMHTLEEALVSFPGCAMVVSHDRYFLDRVATTILAFEPDGQAGHRVVIVEGDYSHYRERARREARAPAAEASATPAGDAGTHSSDPPAGRRGGRAAGAPGPRRLTWAERQELEGIEPRIEALEEQVGELEAELSDPDIWSGQPPRGLEVQAALDSSRAELEALYARWEYLAEGA